MSDFKPGEKVRDGIGQMVRVEAGPFRGPSGDVYAVCAEYEGSAASEPWVILASELHPIPPADPRVDVVAKAAFESHANRPWTETGDVARSIWESNARAILAALDAMPQGQNGAGAIPGVIEGLFPSAPRRVRDRDGDVWERNAQGTWGLTWSVDTVHMKRHYEDVDRIYGPLTPIS